MSWLEALAAKTENLLNKVDQVAGQALQNTTLDKSDSSSNLSQWQQQSFKDKKSVTIEDVNTYSPYLSDKSENITNAISQPINKASKVNQTKDLDSELLEFLNSSQPPPPLPSFTPSALNKQLHSRSSSNTSMKLSQDNDNTEAIPKINQHEQEMTMTSSRSELKTNERSFLDKQDGHDDKMASTSSVEVENQLLKNEIHSLNREMQSILSRIQNNQEELNRANKKLDLQSRQMMKSEQIIRELQDRESDLSKALDAKDTQLSVLRIRLEEADAEVKAKNKKIHEIQSEKEDLLQDHSLSTGVQTHALDTLQDKLKEAELMLKQEMDRCSRIEDDYREKVAKLESDKDNLMTEASNLQRTLAREKSNNVDMANQLRISKSQAETAKQELSQYKDKATRILQSKDRLIATLKESDRVDGSGASEPTIHATEMESLRQERDVLREDYNSCQMALENLRAELLDVEGQMQQEVDSMKDQMKMMEEQLDGEKKKREEAEADVNKHKQELRYVHEDALKQKTAFQLRVQDREAEIQRLRNLLTTKSMNATSQEELEGRLHQLTESLIQKQTTVESLSTEKNSLLLQLERMEKQCREAESSAMRSSSTLVHLNSGPDDDEVRSRFSTFMKESPFDGKVTRKVKMAANSIDKFSMRLGLFLRRYPMARVFIILYMFILHLWVMIVMLTYKPEIHADDFVPGLPHSS